MMRIYTAGYSGLDPIELAAFAHQHNLLIVDTRLNPYSYRKEWSRDQLYQFFGRGRYMWKKEFGNRHYKGGGPIEIADFETGAWLIEQRRDDYDGVLLLCGCHDHRTCHRSLVAEMLAERWDCNIIHLNAELEPVQPEPSIPRQLVLL